MSNTKVTKATEVVVAKIPARIYLGPNLPGGRLLQSTVFSEEIPFHLKALLDEQPDVATLIVPIDEMADVQVRIIQKGTPDHGAYQAILRGGVVGGI
jgi:hypothetical protein